MAYPTILEIAQQIADEVGFARVSSLVTSTGETERQLKAQLLALGEELRVLNPWAELTKEYTFTLVDGQDAYPLPPDFDRQVFNTHWDRANLWRLIGPLSGEEWQWYKSGIIANGPRMKFRLKGLGTNQFYVHPTPGAGDAGNTLVFEYFSKNWILPTDWTTGATFAAGDYCFYNGNYYSTVLGGTTGATAPTHTSGTVNDGGVDWAYEPSYETFLKDTDRTAFPFRLMVSGGVVRWKEEKTLDLSLSLPRYKAILESYLTAVRGARNLSMIPRPTYVFLSFRNVPDSGYGQ